MTYHLFAYQRIYRTVPSRPDAPSQVIGILIGQAHRRLRRAIDLHLQPFGLTEALWLPLLRLSRAEGPLRQKELAALLSLDGSSVVRLLDGLQAAGYIERREDDGDRRAKAITLTDAGRKVVTQVEITATRVRNGALAGLPAEDIATAVRVLRHLCDTLSEDDEAA